MMNQSNSRNRYNELFRSQSTIPAIKSRIAQILSEYGINPKAYGRIEEKGQWVLLQSEETALLAFRIPLTDGWIPVKIRSRIHPDFLANAARVLEILKSIHKMARFDLAVAGRLSDVDLVYLFFKRIDWVLVPRERQLSHADTLFPQLGIKHLIAPGITGMVLDD